MIATYVVVFRDAEDPLLVAAEKAPGETELGAITRVMRIYGYDAVPVSFAPLGREMVVCTIVDSEPDKNGETDPFPLELELLEYANEVEEITGKVVIHESQKSSEEDDEEGDDEEGGP